MSNILRATLIGAAIFASSSAVLALDGDANPVPNNGAYLDHESYIYSDAARYSPFWMTPARAYGLPVRALTASERRALNRANGMR